MTARQKYLLLWQFGVEEANLEMTVWGCRHKLHENE